MSIHFSFIILIATLLCSSCQNSSKNNQVGFGELQFESFAINCQTDTTIKAKNGVRLIVNANTFDCAKGEQIEIKFKSALKVSEMLQAGLHTMTEDARPLESGGMFFLEVTSGQVPNPNNPIIIQVPTKFTQEDMQVFEQKEDGSWKESTVALTISNKKRLQLGKRLFLENCASCHNANLAHDMTAPALGNIDNHRDRAWLIGFTRNSVSYIEAGDSIAVCLYNAWNNAQMTAFANLTDNEINAIYDWIANKSKAKRLKNRDNLEGVDCNRLDSLARDYTKRLKEQQRLQKLRDSLRRLKPTVKTSTDTISNTVTYSSPIPSGYGWINYDRYYGEFELIDLPILSIKENESYLQAYLILKERKTILSFQYITPNKYQIYSSDKDKKIALPTDEPAAILAYQTNNVNREVTHYYIQDYNLSNQTKEISVTLSPIQNKKFLQLLKQQFD